MQHPGRKTTDVKKNIIATTTTTGCMTATTRTITAGTITKTAPFACIWARDTVSTILLSNRKSKNKGRIGIGVTAIQIMIATAASH